MTEAAKPTVFIDNGLASVFFINGKERLRY